MRALFLGRALHSHYLNTTYDHYFYDRAIIQPRLPLGYEFQYERAPLRQELIEQVIRNLEEQFKIKLVPLATEQIVSTIDVMGIDTIDVYPGYQELIDVPSDPRIRVITEGKPWVKYPTFTSFYKEFRNYCFDSIVAKTTIERRLIVQLNNFLSLELRGYAKARGRLTTKGGFSLLAPYIAIGTLDPRDLYVRISELESTHAGEDLEEFRRQCAWILYLRMKLKYFLGWELPPLTREQAMRFKEWKDGLIPAKADRIAQFINHYNIKLKEGHSVSNRYRLITSYYLSRVMRVPWEWGEAYFRMVLLDYHPAANFMNWYLQCVRNRHLWNYNLSRQIDGFENYRGTCI